MGQSGAYGEELGDDEAPGLLDGEAPGLGEAADPPPDPWVTVI